MAHSRLIEDDFNPLLSCEPHTALGWGAVAAMGMGERGWEPGLGGLVGPPTGLEGQRSWDFAFGQIFWAGSQGTAPLGGVCGWG